MRYPNRTLGLIVVVLLLAVPTVSVAQEDPKETKYLVDGRVLDAVTGKPITRFRVIPGSRSRARSGGKAPDVSVWQPHLIREMSNGAFLWPRARGYAKMSLRIEAEGYVPTTTEWTGKDQPQIRPEIRLQPATFITGTVTNSKGLPVAGATLSVSLPNSTVRLDGCNFARSDETPEKLSDWWRIPRMMKCDEQGRFEIPLETDPLAVLCVVHEDGYFDQSFVDFAARENDGDDVNIVLQRWGRVEGRVWWLDKPGVGEQVTVSVHREFNYPEMIAASPHAVTDEKGAYVIEFVPPGWFQFGHPVKLPAEAALSAMGVRFDYPVFHATLKPGETVRIDVGGDGIVATGKLTGLDSYEGVTLSIRPPAPDTFSWFKMGMSAGGDDLMKGYTALSQSSFAALYFREDLPVDSDGTFRIPDVMTGEYDLRVKGAVGATTFKASSLEGKTIDLGTITVSPSAM